jgi:alpha-1,2-mannosyltransferase
MPESSPPSGNAVTRSRVLRIPSPTVVIVIVTAAGFSLRFYQLLSSGYLLGVTEYDDGVYFGAAVRFIHGQLPYGNFVLLHPPGILVVLAPFAALSRVIPTSDALAVARIVTVCASAANIALVGVLLRRRGVLAVAAGTGLAALYPPDVETSHTTMLEPWAALFCLLGLIVLFRRRETASMRQLLMAGALLGITGSIKVWAIIPVLLTAALCLREPKRVRTFCAGVALGFGFVTVPFAVITPIQFVRDVILAQANRQDIVRTPLPYRLTNLLGLDGVPPIGHLGGVLATMFLAALIVGALLITAAVSLARPGEPDQVALLSSWTTIVTVALFLYPPNYYYHYAAFLTPFLALSMGIAASKIRTPGTSTVLGCVGIVLLLGQLLAIGARPDAWSPKSLASQVIPDGACVLTDTVSLTIAANRFMSRSASCATIVDTIGTSYSFSRGRNAVTGAGSVPALRDLWSSAFRSANYVWLSDLNARRIPWTPEIQSYFHTHFVLVPSFTDAPAKLYMRRPGGRSGESPDGP